MIFLSPRVIAFKLNCLFCQELILKRFGFLENRTQITFPTVNVMEPTTIETTTTTATSKASVDGSNLPFWKYIHCTGAMSVGIPIYKKSMLDVFQSSYARVIGSDFPVCLTVCV